jgi:glycosyltransferase involved in cell wall biosynthesis
MYAIPKSFHIVQVPERGARGFHTAAFIASARRALRRHKAGLIISRDLFALASVAHWGVPMIYEAHQMPVYGRIGTSLFSWVARRPNFRRLVTVSQALADSYTAAFPLLRGTDVRVVPDAANDIQTEAQALSGERMPWPGRPDAISVGYVGHLYEGRGIDLIIAAANQLPDLDFHIVGGTDDDLAKWKSRAGSMNLFFHGFQQPHNLARFYSRFNIVAAPYHRQVFSAGGRDIAPFMSPMKLFEYMASGCAMIVGDLPVVREVLRDGENALLFAPGDSADWIAKLRHLAADTELRRRLADNARTDFLQHYTWSSRATAMLQGIT